MTLFELTIKVISEGSTNESHSINEGNAESGPYALTYRYFSLWRYRVVFAPSHIAIERTDTGAYHIIQVNDLHDGENYMDLYRAMEAR